MAFIVSVDPGERTLTYDVIQWLSGEEANEAYRKDTGDESGAPNDYYIVNDNTMARTLAVSDDACIAIFETGDPESEKALADLASLERFLQGRPRGDSERPSDPFRVKREGDRITAIQQQWRP